MSEDNPKVEAKAVVVVKAKPDRKIYRPRVKIVSRIPASIESNPLLLDRLRTLPDNYNFEVPKTIWRIQQLSARRVALQMPEGLLMFAITLCDIIEEFTGAETVIMGDVTYGACCIDDYTARALDADLLVHYGHSCLIPINPESNVKFLYIFVDIKIDVRHFTETIKKNMNKKTDKIAMVSTVQFITALHAASQFLKEDGYETTIPQSKPLSPGEILGCTSPSVHGCNILLYLGDGRFHLESAMIANPSLQAYKYDPYEKKLTREIYDHKLMRKTRYSEILRAAQGEKFGLILGTLGRQGSSNVLQRIQASLSSRGKEYSIFLLSEIFPEKLKLMPEVDAWIQVACPRLSIDWGGAFDKPLLSPYEVNVAFGCAKHPPWAAEDETYEEAYPMDYYANDTGNWGVNRKEGGCCGKNCKDKIPAL